MNPLFERELIMKYTAYKIANMSNTTLLKELENTTNSVLSLFYYANLTDAEKDNITNEAIIECKSEIDEEKASNFIEYYSGVLKKIAKEYILDEIKNNSGRVKSIIESFIQTDIKATTSNTQALKSFKKLSTFVDFLNYELTIDDMTELIRENSTISSLVTAIYRANEKLIKSGDTSKIHDTFIEGFINSYCMINGIEIDNESDDLIEIDDLDNTTENMGDSVKQYLREISSSRILDTDEGRSWSSFEKRSLLKIKDMVESNGAVVLDSLDEIADFLNRQ